MTGPVREAREELRKAAGELQEVQRRLTRIQEALPASPSERSPEDLNPRPDVVTEIRAVIGCVKRDFLGPAMRDLLVAAAYRSGVPAAKGGLIPPGLDLAMESEEIRQALYALVARDHFGPAPEGEPAGRWRPPYTPEAAGLRVFFEHGRWFATWVKLEEPKDLPEAERRALLVLTEDPEEIGRLIYRGV